MINAPYKDKQYSRPNHQIDNMRLRRWERELVNELLDWEYGNNALLNQIQNGLAEHQAGQWGGLTFKDAHQNQINQNTDAIKKLTATVEELIKNLKSAEERIKHLEKF